MRWGLLSALAALLLRLFGRSGGGWARALVAAVVLSAAFFAASHLPALYLDGVPPDPLVARTLALNFLLGLFFGAVFVRRGLEAAIAAHGGFHLGVMAAALTARFLLV